MTKRDNNSIVNAVATECEALQVADRRKAESRAQVIQSEPSQLVTPNKEMNSRRKRLAAYNKNPATIPEDVY